MTEQLKPCPFCGSEAIIIEVKNGFIVLCVMGCVSMPYGQNAFTSEEQATKYWNKRSQVSSIDVF